MPRQHPPQNSLDVPLFDIDTLTHTLRDTRTVGEMLADVDYLARQMLMDVAGEDAPGLVRSWPALVEAAQSFWSALPGRRLDHDPNDAVIERLSSQAATMTKWLDEPGHWPPAGRVDPRIAEMITNFSTAADLVNRYGPEIPTYRGEVRRDLDASRTRAVHGLYLTAHAVGVALRHEGAERSEEAQAKTGHRSYWRGRFTAAENIAHRFLTRVPASDLNNELIQPVRDHTRAARALARWDVQTHRTLAADPSPGNIQLTARTQGLIAGAAITLVTASHSVGRDESPRLLELLGASGQAWAHLASRWSDLTLPTSRIDPLLLAAASEVRATFRELTHDGATMAATSQIATRPGVEPATQAALRAAETAPDLAQVILDLAHQPDLAGGARALSRRVNNDIEAGLVPAHPDENHLWITPQQIFNKNVVAAPRPVVDALISASHQLHAVAGRAGAVAGMSSESRPSLAHPQEQDRLDIGIRHAELREPPCLHMPRPIVSRP